MKAKKKPIPSIAKRQQSQPSPSGEAGNNSASSDPSAPAKTAIASASATGDQSKSAPSTSPWLWYAWGALALAIIVGLFSFPQHPLLQRNLTSVGGGYDFFHSYAIVNALEHKISNVYSSQELLDYTNQMSGGRDWGVNDNHLLPFYLLYLPLAQRDFNSGYYIHLWINLNLFWIAALALCFSVMDTRRHAWILCALLLICSLTIGPAVDNIWLGQISMGFTCVMAFVFLFDNAGNQKLAGLFLALAILLKMYPAILLVYFLIKKRYKLLQWALVTLLALAISAGLQWGFSHYLNYWEFLAHTMSYNANVANQSLMGVLAATCPYLAPDELKTVHISLLILGTTALVWMSLKRQSSTSLPWNLLEYSIWVTSAMVLSPISWGHHHVLLILPLAAWFGLLLNGDASANANLTLRRWSLAGILLTAVLWCLEGETATNASVKMFHLWCCLHHLGLIGLLALLGVELRCLGLESGSAIPDGDKRP